MANSDVHNIILQGDDGTAWRHGLCRPQGSSSVSIAEGDGYKFARVSINNALH